MGKSYWMINISVENYKVTRNRGLTIQGFRNRYRKRVQRMGPGDKLLFYVKEIQGFVATGTITSIYSQSDRRIWKSPNNKEVFPLRIKLQPEVVLADEDILDARDLAFRLDYVKRWAPEEWSLAFHGDLHLIPQSDFRLIEDEMSKLRRTGSSND